MLIQEIIEHLNNQAHFLLADYRKEEALVLMERVYDFLGIRIGRPRQDVPIESYLLSICNHIACLMNNNLLYEVERDFGRFERIVVGKYVSEELLFHYQYYKVEYYFRRGYYILAMEQSRLLEKYAVNDQQQFCMLLQRGEIENADRNIFALFSVNSVSKALSIAERMHDAYSIGLAYSELSEMFTFYYPSLAFNFAKKSELEFARNGFKQKANEQEVSLANALIIKYLKDPQHSECFKKDAKRKISLVDKSKIRSVQHLANYDYVYGLVYDNIDSLLSAANFYKKLGSHGGFCQVMDRIIHLRLWRKEYRQAETDIHDYLVSARKMNRKDITTVEDHYKNLKDKIHDAMVKDKKN